MQREDRVFGEPIILRPRHGIERETTFYSFKRGGTRFEVSAADLAQTLESSVRRFPKYARLVSPIENHGRPRDRSRSRYRAFGAMPEWEAEMAAELRFAISSSEHALREGDVPGLEHFAKRLIGKYLVEMFEKGSVRVVKGAEAGSELVLLNWESPDMPLASQGGDVVCWSGSGKRIAARITWVS